MRAFSAARFTPRVLSVIINNIYYQSGIGIKVDNCESDESMSEDDYIELPAVTKHCDDVPLKPCQTTESENTTLVLN